jgi:tetratricopeptide (TPR) repeat protein
MDAASLDIDAQQISTAGTIQLVSHDEIVRLPPTTRVSKPERVVAPPLRIIEAPQSASSPSDDLDFTSAPRPIPVRQLELMPADRSTSTAEAEHQRLVAENLKVSPLAGTNNYEQPMDDTVMSDTEAPDAPLTQAEAAAAVLSQEVIAQANRMMKEAVQLADRGAIFAAQVEFERVLRMVSQSLDAKIGRSYHSRCLTRGLRALDEADDFASHSKCAETDTDLGGFIAGHQTTVLHSTDASTLTPLTAMRHYYDYAHDQLIRAGGHSSAASMSLFAMGRANTLMNRESNNKDTAPKSLAFYNAALAVDPNNAQAANELAVMLAKSGHLKHAADVLQQSSKSAPSSIGLRNLSQIYRQLGKQQAAQQVLVTHERLKTTPGALATTAGERHQQIRWVSPQQFNQTASAIDSSNESPPVRAAELQQTPMPQAPRARAKSNQNHWW